MKKQIWLVALFAICAVNGLNAQLLWKVSGNGLNKPSYLFGTHHLIEKEQIKDFDKMLALAGQADAVVGEVDMTDMAAVQAKAIQGMVMQGTTMKQLLNAEDYALVDSAFKPLIGVGLDRLGAFKPMALESMYTVMLYLKFHNLSKQPEAVDILFQKKAKELNKQVIALETFEQQSAILFDSLPLNRQTELLVKCIKEKDKGLDLLKRMNEVYLSGDLQKMIQLDKEEDDMTPSEKKMLVETRNNNWMKQLPGLFSKQTCFVAVGCMHLVDESGLISQLRKAGYKVEAVTNL